MLLTDGNCAKQLQSVIFHCYLGFVPQSEKTKPLKDNLVVRPSVCLSVCLFFSGTTGRTYCIK